MQEAFVCTGLGNDETYPQSPTSDCAVGGKYREAVGEHLSTLRSYRNLVTRRKKLVLFPVSGYRKHCSKLKERMGKMVRNSEKHSGPSFLTKKPE